jgi:hypothetical protein
MLIWDLSENLNTINKHFFKPKEIIMDSSFKLPKIHTAYVIMDGNEVYGVYVHKKSAEEIASYFPDALKIVKTEIDYN